MNFVFANPVDPPAEGGVWWVSKGLLFPNDLSLGNPRDPYAESDDGPFHAMGLAHLSFGEVVQIAWDVDHIQTENIQCIARLISDVTDRPVDLMFYKNGWATESCASITEGCRRFLQISQHRGVSLVRSTLMQERGIADIGSHGLLADTLAAWRGSSSMVEFQRSRVYDSCITCRPTWRGLMWETIGPESAGAQFFGNDWRMSAVGKPVVNLKIDEEYELRASECYRSTIESRRPRYDHVLFSAERRGRRLWTAYERLTLPLGDSLVSAARLVPLSDSAVFFLRC